MERGIKRDSEERREKKVRENNNEAERKKQGGGERTGRFAASHAERMRNRGKEKKGRRKTKGGRVAENWKSQLFSTSRNHAKELEKSRRSEKSKIMPLSNLHVNFFIPLRNC